MSASGSKKRVVIESHIPAVPQRLSDAFDIVRLDPEEIDSHALAHADALIVRTRTRCDSALLGSTPVDFVATATIGTDHIDIPWCRSRGIDLCSAPGCNAPAVAQYLFASLLTVFPEGLRGITLGIIGVGHVGSIVARWAPQLGMNTLLCDPPRSRKEHDVNFVGLDDIAAHSDIVTFHVPHTRLGADATHHLADGTFFRQLKPGATIVNSARGPILDTQAAVEAISSGKVSHAIIDCWEGEPQIDPRLLDLADIATPHIAGYSREGKIRATSTVVAALCRHFAIDDSLTSEILAEIPAVAPGAADSVTELAIRESYNPLADTSALRSAFLRDGAPAFEALRNHYPLRAEVK